MGLRFPPCRVAVIGLGYVGLPLAVAFSRHTQVVGFDIDSKRVADLRRGVDTTGEVRKEDLLQPRLSFTAEPEDLQGSEVFIVTVPTPMDATKRPDLRLLASVTRTVGRYLKPGAVVYESTVYPGCVEHMKVFLRSGNLWLS